MRGEPPALVIASKSAWDPPIRREHHLAKLGVAHGHPVSFIERSVDIRSLARRGRIAWCQGLRPAPDVSRPGSVNVVARSALLPAHTNRLFEGLDGRVLARAVPDAGQPRPTVVATLPWHWPAVSRMPGYRHVLDVADDWSRLMPPSARRVRELHARAAAEADAIVVVSESLRPLFPSRQVEVVRNGLDESLLSRPHTAPPAEQRLIYVGTLSERFDCTLTGALLDCLPGWTLDLYGACSYARRGNRPGDDLAVLLGRPDGRVRWHGPLERSRVAKVIDRADVLLLPNHPLGRGQDSMKVYDYSARGRPIVASDGAVAGISEPPPHLRAASTAGELAEQVRAAVDEPPGCREDRIVWARAQTWEARWPQWSHILFGTATAEQTCQSASGGADESAFAGGAVMTSEIGSDGGGAKR